MPALPDLTPAELAVARLVAAGRSNRETAAELYVSVKTVEFHLGHIFGKLGIRSRKDLIARIGRRPAAPPGRKPRVVTRVRPWRHESCGHATIDCLTPDIGHRRNRARADSTRRSNGERTGHVPHE